jgi:hypothetical protein
MLCPPVVAADEWIEDEDLHDFYPQGAQRDRYEVPSRSPYDNSPNDDGEGGMNEDGFFSSSQQDVPIAPPGGQMGVPFNQNFRPNMQTPPKKKGVLGKIGSMVKAPFDAAGDFFGSPELWYGAGQLAGAGANMYMNRNNPYYGGGWNNPYSPYSPYNLYGNPYGFNGIGGPYSSFGYEPLGMMNPFGMGYNLGPSPYTYTPTYPYSPYSSYASGLRPNPMYPGNGIYNPGLGGVINPGLGGVYNPGFTPGLGGISPLGLGGALAPMTVPYGGSPFFR